MTSFYELLNNSAFSLNNVTLFSQGKVDVQISYSSYCEDICTTYQLDPKSAIKLADSFTSQIAIYGYSRDTLSNLRVKIEDTEFKLQGMVANKMSTKLKQGDSVQFYNPKRICSFRALEIKRFIESSTEIEHTNLTKKLDLPDDYKSLAFIGSEYAVENFNEACTVLHIAEKLDASTIKKDRNIKQFDRTLRFLKAANFLITKDAYLEWLKKKEE